MAEERTQDRRRRLRRPRRFRPGASPGALVVEPGAPAPEVTVMAWGPDVLVEETVTDEERLRELPHDYPVTWVNLYGIGDAELLERLGSLFDIHPLALEDVVNVPQRPKLETYEASFFIVLHMLALNEDELAREQISLFVRDGLVLTFQERPGDCLELVRERIRSGRPRIRAGGTDYLAYALVDAVVDHYIPLLEEFENRLETLEGRIQLGELESPLDRIRARRRDLMDLRRAIVPVREVTWAMIRDESGFFTSDTRVFLRDCHDHALQVVDQVDVCRELASGLMDTHLSTTSHRTNETMKVLTVIATIFMPLSFLAGVYGMNFDTSWPWNMPELSWRFGYPAVLVFMALVALLLLLFFRRRDWL